MEFYIYLTNRCNLNCEYCSVISNAVRNGFPERPIYTNKDLLQFILKTLQDKSNRDIYVYFFGGEPTLEIDKMEEIMLYLNQYSNQFSSIRYILHTNGLLLNNIANCILKDLSFIIISINVYKMNLSNDFSSYYNTIIGNAFHVKEISKATIIARFTIDENSNILSAISMMQPVADYFYWQIENKSSNSHHDKLRKHYEYYINVMLTYWIEEMRKGNLLGLLPFIALSRSLVLQEQRGDEGFACGYSKSLYYIQTSGDVFSCSDNTTSTSHHIGTITGGSRFSSVTPSDYMCRECDIVTLCGGRCGRMHIDFSISRVREYCQLSRLLITNIRERQDSIATLLESPGMLNKIMQAPITMCEIMP